MSSARVLAVALALTACTTEHVFVTPRAILRHAPELRAAGRADVEVSGGGTHALSADDTFELALGKTRSRISVRAMLDGCPDAVPFAGLRVRRACPLLDTSTSRLEVDRRHHIDWTIPKVFLGAALVTTAFGAVMSLVCDSSASGCR